VSDEGTPLLRADAADDDLHYGEPESPAETSAIMEEPAPKCQVPVVIDGVFHGMRDEE
jgi:hypothetical protein